METPVLDAPPEPTAAKFDRTLTGLLVGLMILVLVEAVTGFLMKGAYSNKANFAYASVKEIPAYVRGVHYWSSALLIAGGILLIIGMTAERWFRRFPMLWYAGLILFLASFLSQVSGNLLPFDRHGVQTAVVEASISRGAPGAGEIVAKQILNGDQFTGATLERWAAAHIQWFGIIALLGAVLGIVGLSKAPVRPSRALPAITVLAGLILGGIAAPLGHPATPADFGQQDAQVSWYTWPLHGLLNLFNKINPSVGWIGAIAIPSLFIAILALAPVLAKRDRLVAGAIFGFVAVMLVAAVAFGGRFASLIGNRDPAPVATTGGERAKLDPVLVAKGKEVFAKYGCAGCHGENGSRGTSGPTLAGIVSRRGSDPLWYVKFVQNPSSVKASSTMPAFGQVSNEELRQLAEFLMSI